MPFKVFEQLFRHPLTDKGLESFSKDLENPRTAWRNWRADLVYRRWQWLEVSDDRFRIGVADVMEHRQGSTTRV